MEQESFGTQPEHLSTPPQAGADELSAAAQELIVQPSPPEHEAGHAPPASRPARRRWVTALVALHVLSALAAAVILVRNHRPSGPDGASRLKLLSRSEGVVGWVAIHGVIQESENGRPWERGVEQWARRVRQLGEKSEVKAIVLQINSPGGTVGAVQELYSAVERVRKETHKPVVALMGDVAASGGYYVAAGCDKIVAHPGTLVGSIGVIFNTMNVEKLLEKIGVKTDAIKSGAHKDIGSMTRAMTPEERRILQGLIDDAYGQFLRAVTDGRKLPETVVRPLADGRIFTGEQALSLKLVDQLGDSRDAIALAGKLGGISGTPKVLRDTDSFENIFGMLEFGLSRSLRPEAAALREIVPMSPGLEYRWLGF